MEDDIIEMIFSGFCRTYNQGNMVTCEFRRNQGALLLEDADCAYDQCIHKGSCEVAKQIQAVLTGKETQE